MYIEAANVDEYLQKVPEDRKAALNKLRDRCREILVGFDESLEYGMPAYGKDGFAGVAFANQKHYIALYVTNLDVVNRHRDELPKNTGKCCVRYSSPAKMDFTVIDQMLRETATEPGVTCE